MVYLEAVIQGFSLKQLFYFIYTLGIPVVGSISSRAAGTMSAVLVGWAPSWVFLKYFIYCVNCCFLGNCPQWLVHDFKYTFHFNLHGRKALWRVLFTCIFLINIWYFISCLLNINTQVGNLQSFPSQTTNLLTQCFY